MAIIKIKRGPTVPTGLTAGELAFDYINGNLFIGATGSTISRIAGTSFVSTFNGLSGAVSGVTTGTANTFTALQSFNSGISAGTGVTFSSNIAVNGGSITTTSTTANVFNTTATTLNIGGASTVTTIAGVASGLTLDIANTTHFSGQKNINIATNVSGGGTQRIAIGQGGGSIISSTGGLTMGSGSGSSVTNIIGTAFNITPLTTMSGGISASSGTFSGTQTFINGATFSGLAIFNSGISATGGITFNAPISSTRLPRFTSAAFETKVADFTPSNADNGKVFLVNHTSKTAVTVTLDNLNIGWRAKFIAINSGAMSFSSSFGSVYGAYGADGANTQPSLLDPIVEVICYDTNLYFAG